ncbi:MAG: nicotinate phosphoribosyltransferase [Calditrichaeota bacterium]|nr:nicotinate phosphoribosyltransferase [Calditrichota bacterium]RQW06447.1 MAG: nicotinate phosphoribosyltransferase [Calditrichota bacterium]
MKKFNKKIAEGILFTDQYQFTMAQLYFKLGYHEKLVHFDHFFRSYPDYDTHKAGYCINAGLEWFIDWMDNVRFTEEDIHTLKSQKNDSGQQVFEDDFLNWLKNNGSFENLDIQAIPEGRVIHPNEPITVVTGPLAMAQIIETALLNQLNYQILIATKACRISLSGMEQMLLEFGARRAHDMGANAGVRAALIGGADFSSNVGISHVLGYPPKGTHSHAMVQFFLAMGMSEEDAFQAYAELYPDNSILLVDTINTLESGIPNAIKVFEKLKKKGHKPLGIRLDSGDLAYLSLKAARMLNDAGFPDAKIVLSNELDELTIWQIISQIQEEGSRHGLDPDQIIKRLVYGVGTRLITSEGSPALGGVYKLTGVYNNDEWIPAIKISENIQKVPNPARKKIWRIYDKRNIATADFLTTEQEDIRDLDNLFLQHPTDPGISRTLKRKEISDLEELLVDIRRNGSTVYEFPDIEGLRKTRKKDLERLDPGVKRLINPHIYHVSLSANLWELKKQLIQSLDNGEENSFR